MTTLTNVEIGTFRGTLIYNSVPDLLSSRPKDQHVPALDQTLRQQPPLMVSLSSSPPGAGLGEPGGR